MSTTRRTFHTARGTEILRRAQVVVGAAIAANASSYWTFTLTRIPVGELDDLGETIGTAFSTQYRSIAAGTPEILYDDETGVTLYDGEKLVATRVSTGTPATPTDARFLIEKHRVTR
jgi:hypothetical protein